MHRLIPLSEMKFPTPLVALIASALSLSGATISLETIGFDPVSEGPQINPDYRLLAASFSDSAFSASNGGEYAVIRNLVFAALDDNDTEDFEDDDTNVYSCNYVGVEAQNQTEIDKGRLMIVAPSEDQILALSGAVGFIRRSGGWNKTGESLNNTIAGMAGTGVYTNLKSAREFSIALQGTKDGVPLILNSETESTVISTDNVLIDSWVADGAGSTIEYVFSNLLLERENNVYEGLLTRTDELEPDQWESKYALIRVVDNNDTDGDGIPDLSDLGADVISSILQPMSISTGDNSFWSPDLNTTVTVKPEDLWHYGENLGWFYLPDQNDPTQIKIFIPDERLGWLLTNAETSPYYIRESDSAVIYFELIDEQIWFYDFSSETWYSL